MRAPESLFCVALTYFCVNMLSIRRIFFGSLSGIARISRAGRAEEGEVEPNQRS